MEDKRALDFLEKHGMSYTGIDLEHEAKKMAEEMERGLRGENCSLPMIPTRLFTDGVLPKNKPAAVIDAGGTNFRCALVSFTDEGCRVERAAKAEMPGIGVPADWEEFIAFTADMIQPLMDSTDVIGFCFSYSAEITPELDGIVRRIDKEVVIRNSTGKRVCASLLEELERRGIHGKKAVLLNDTAAVLLGGSAAKDKTQYSAIIGQVSGTGTNTCCAIPVSRIGKLDISRDGAMIVNLESGMYTGISQGDFDAALDSGSENPGMKQFEKQTAGVYLGALCAAAISAAADEGIISKSAAENAAALGKVDSAVADAWACGEGLEKISAVQEDREFIKALCGAVIERSAKFMAVNLAALLSLTGAGRDKPALICAEGSLVQKSRVYRPALERYLSGYAIRHDLRYEYLIGNGSTLSGSAAAALLNIR